MMNYDLAGFGSVQSGRELGNILIYWINDIDSRAEFAGSLKCPEKLI